MVNVGAKPATARVAVAEARVSCSAETQAALLSTATAKKGEAIVTAKLAGILAAKQTDRLIPLCHGLALEDVAVDIDAVDDAHGCGFVVRARAQTTGKTGVEMEAMVAASVAALTLYDMGKARERGMVIAAVRLLEKSGGKSGTWRAPAQTSTQASKASAQTSTQASKASTQASQASSTKARRRP